MSEYRLRRHQEITQPTAEVPLLVQVARRLALVLVLVLLLDSDRGQARTRGTPHPKDPRPQVEAERPQARQALGLDSCMVVWDLGLG